jgi:hypothetical protein
MSRIDSASTTRTTAPAGHRADHGDRGGNVSQQFTFPRRGVRSNNRCANNSSGTIKIVGCTGGPVQQWSINPNGTISDIQTGSKCFQTSGTSVLGW